MFELKNYLKSLPQNYKANQAFKDWLHDEADIDTKRGIVKGVEKRIKSMMGHRDLHLPHIGEKKWKVLEALIEVRQATLDEMMMPTKEEVEMMRAGSTTSSLASHISSMPRWRRCGK